MRRSDSDMNQINLIPNWNCKVGSVIT